MAYRKTEKVLAKIEARRNSIIASAIDVISKHGMAGLTTDAVKDRAGVAVGLIYKYFPDKTELVAAAMGFLLNRDLAAMREAAAGANDSVEALAAAIVVFYGRLGTAPLIQALAESPIYSLGVRREFERLIKPVAPDLTPKDRQQAAAAALGAFYGMTTLSDPSKDRASAVVLFVLRGVGISDAIARRAIERRYSLVTA